MQFPRVKTLATLLAAAGLGITACSSVPTDLDLPQATAEAELFRADMPVDPRDNGLNWSQLGLLEAVADEYKTRGHGPLVISYPQGAANEEAAMLAIANARTVFYEAGVDWRQISGGPYDARGHGDAAVIFTFTRYRAIAPDCPQGWPNMARNLDNRHEARFGCAMAANLAEMVSDPRDLIAPRDMGPSDTGRRQTVMDRYRAGESTTSQRSEYESGAVSNVAND